MPSFFRDCFISITISIAAVTGGFSSPSLAAAEPEVSALAKRWPNAPNLDVEVAWQESPPEGLQGVWQAFGKSDNQGQAVTEFSEPKPFMVIRPDGWQLPDGVEEKGVQPFLKFGRFPDAADKTQTWIVLLQKQSQPLVIHSPKDSSLLVVRQFSVAPATGDMTENARWVVRVRPFAAIRPQTHLGDSLPENVAEAKAPARQESARVQPVDGRDEGTLAVEYLSPWNRKDAETMVELFKQHRWPASRTISPGIMVTRVLPGASAELEVHDIIYRIGDVWLKSENGMREALASLRAGVSVEVRVKRLRPNSKGDPTWMTNEFVVTPLSQKEALVAQQRESDRIRRVAEESRRAEEMARQKRIADALHGPSYEYDGRFPKSSFRMRLEEAVLKSDMSSLRLERQLKLVLSRSGLTLNEVDWAEQVLKNKTPIGELSAEETAKYRAFLKLTADGY